MEACSCTWDEEGPDFVPNYIKGPVGSPTSVVSLVECGRCTAWEILDAFKGGREAGRGAPSLAVSYGIAGVLGTYLREPAAAFRP